MDTARTGFFGFSHLQWTAAFSVALLFGAIAWNMYLKPTEIAPAMADQHSSSSTLDTSDDMEALLTSSSESATSSPVTQLGADILAGAISAYTGASNGGQSSGAGIAAVQEAATKITPQVSYQVYAAGDIKTDSDSSQARVLAYRADLRTALEPLFQNKDFELDIFANYINTGDPKYLSELHTTANNYRTAITNATKVIAPADAASYHAGILNSMGEFAATLDAMADSASDPIASAALLKTYTSAQDDMLLSFNAIGAYAAHKMI